MSFIRNKKAQAGLLMSCGVATCFLVNGIINKDSNQGQSLSGSKAESHKSHRKISSRKPSNALYDYYSEPLDLQEATTEAVTYRQGKIQNRSDRELLAGQPLVKVVTTSKQKRKSLKAIRHGLASDTTFLPIQQALAGEAQEFDNTETINSNQPPVEGVTSADRIDSIKNLTVNGMSEEEREIVYDFIGNGTPPEGISLGEYNWLSDELFISLRSQESVPTDLTEKLINFSQTNSNVVLRDYASQHLGHLHEDGGVTGSESEIIRIENALWNATNQPDGTTAGSALIALNRAFQSQRLISDFDIITKSIDLVNDPQYTTESKLVALNILKENGMEDLVMQRAISEIESMSGAQ